MPVRSHPRHLVGFFFFFFFFDCFNCFCHILKTDKVYVNYIKVYICRKGISHEINLNSSDFWLKNVFWRNIFLTTVKDIFFAKKNFKNLPKPSKYMYLENAFLFF